MNHKIWRKSSVTCIIFIWQGKFVLSYTFNYGEYLLRRPNWQRVEFFHTILGHEGDDLFEDADEGQQPMDQWSERQLYHALSQQEHPAKSLRPFQDMTRVSSNKRTPSITHFLLNFSVASV